MYFLTCLPVVGVVVAILVGWVELLRGISSTVALQGFSPDVCVVRLL